MALNTGKCRVSWQMDSVYRVVDTGPWSSIEDDRFGRGAAGYARVVTQYHVGTNGEYRLAW
jgi:hypothetical protein